MPAGASLALLAIFVGTNLISVRTFGEVDFWLASIRVLAIVVFLGAGGLYALGLWPDATLSVNNLWAHGGFAPNGYGIALTGVALVIFSYFGTEIAVMAAAESEDPAKGIRQASSTIIWRILLFFVGAIAVICTVIPWDELPEPRSLNAWGFPPRRSSCSWLSLRPLFRSLTLGSTRPPVWWPPLPSRASARPS